MAPPATAGWLASTPTLRPSRRAKPVITERANAGRSSKKLWSSTSASITGAMS